MSEVAATSAPITEVTRRVALAYLAGLGSGNPEAVAELVTADFENRHASSLGRGVQGREPYRVRLRDFLAEFEGLRYDIEDVVAEGDRATVAYMLSATWHGPPGERHPITVPGVMRLRVRDGLVALRIDYWDSADFFRQTGQR